MMLPYLHTENIQNHFRKSSKNKTTVVFQSASIENINQAISMYNFLMIFLLVHVHLYVGLTYDK